MRLEPPGSDTQTPSLEAPDDRLADRFGYLRPSGSDEARPTALARIRQQGELTDHQDLAPDIDHRAIHSAGLVGEDAELGGLTDHPVDLLRTVAVGYPEQYEQAPTYLSDALGPYIDAGRCDPGHYRPHLPGGTGNDPVGIEYTIDPAQGGQHRV
jgi:hypothetical protein